MHDISYILYVFQNIDIGLISKTGTILMSDIDSPLVAVCVSVLGGEIFVEWYLFDHDTVSDAARNN